MKSIKKFMVETGVPVHLKGYLYICKALDLLDKDYVKLFHLKHEIYDPIAREYNTTSSRVERDIRTAIDATFLRSIYCQHYFPYLDTIKGRPSNKEFLAVMIHHIK